MSKKKIKLKTYSLDHIKNEMIGKRGTRRRERYEAELNLNILGEMIRATRLRRQLTQEELGELIGVQKAQISKLEKSANNVTVDTLLRVFSSMGAKVSFSVELVGR